ncbi:MAG: tripartite tricarboxylate transporter substrate binding protein [Proteobacteria bacterium]|nr:tripartite tricarboxylate transporter substrate binding protein [Pseudomonadota bacterium]
MNILKVLAFAAAALAANAAFAQAEFPSKPIRLVVPFPPGGTTDVLGRIAARRLGDLYGKPVVVENKPGASGHVGAAEVARAAPDGYTLVAGTIGIHAAHRMYKKLTYTPATDLQPITLLAEQSNLLIVNPGVAAKSVEELVALAKARPGALNYASAGPGSSIHMVTELFILATGVKLTHVPYKGSGPALNDLMGGQIQLIFENFPTGLPLVRGGRVRPLAVTGAQREAALPEVPTVAETVAPGFAATSWFTLAGPRGLPAALADRIQSDLKRALSPPEVGAELRAQGIGLVLNTPAEAARFIAAETEKWNRVIDAAKIQVE